MCNSSYLIENYHGTYQADLFSALKTATQSSLVSTLIVDVEGVEHGFLKSRLDEQTLYLPIPERWHRGPARVSIQARQVSISIGQGHLSSMVNRLTAQVVNIVEQENDRVRVSLALGKQLLEVLITQWSLKQLGLSEGMTVFADFKLGAVQWAGQGGEHIKLLTT